MIALLIPLQVIAQELKGTITDTDGLPVIGAAVVIDGTNKGVVSDLNGNYAISVTKGQTLRVSCIGYEDKVIIYNGEAVLNMTLSLETTALDEVVVVGYGEYSRRTITSAIAKLSGDEIADIPVSSVSEALKGKISGLHVVQTNNSPGGSFSMKIRGGSSISNSNEPLVYVDGVERSMTEINANDIASIDVLKDAASSAIYGARGSNGVILITTKKGSFGRAPKVTFETNLAYQEPETLRKFLNAEDYINILRPAVEQSASPAWNYNSGWSASSGNTGSSIYSTRYYNEGDTLPKGWKTMADPLDPNKTLMFCDTDWQSIMFRPAMWQSYYLGLDGGSENIRYNGSFGYVDDDGIGLATGYSKFSIKSNAEIKVAKKLTASINSNFQYTSTDAYANQRYAISRGLSAAPTQITYYEDGTPALGYNQTSQTPLYYTYYSDNTSVNKHLSLAGTLKWEILPGWTASGTASYYSVEAKNSTFLRSNYYDQSRPATSTWAETRRLKTDAYTQYKKTIKDTHNIDLMAGFSWQNRRYEMLGATGFGGSSDKITTIDAASETTGKSTINEDAQIGFFTRGNYDFKNKYLLTLVARYDASSKFMEANRWGFFPGVSAGWIVSEEPWMKPVKQINYLKARVSLGQTGNNNIGISDAMGKYTATYTYNGNAAIRGTTMPNQNLFWETTTQLDVGFEIGLFRNKIYLTTDYYDKYTDNLLYDMSLPNTSGYSKVTTNLGTVRYWGVELELTTKNIEKENFSWETKLTYSLNKNVVVKLPDNGVANNRTGTTAYPIYSNGDGTFFGGLAEGEPLYRFYGYKAISIFQTDEEAANAAYDQLARGFNYKDGTTVPGRKFAGDYEWADRNGDGVITKQQDLFCLGVTEPPINGGINNTIKLGPFTFNLYMDYAIGHSIYDESLGRYFYATFSCNYALSEYVKDCWKKAGDVTRYAKFWANDSGAGQDNFNRMSNIFTYRGDYLCFRELSVKYDVSKQFCKKFGMSGLQLSLSGNNLYYLTAVEGISPEVGTASTYNSSYCNYPPVRKFTMGVKVKF
jgi:TonB-linked SusC/RagA family outer membrane protein